MRNLLTFTLVFAMSFLAIAQIPVTVDDVSYPRIDVTEGYASYQVVNDNYWTELNDNNYGQWADTVHRWEMSLTYGVASAGFVAPNLFVNSNGNDILLNNGDVYCFKTLVPAGALIITEYGGTNGENDALSVGTTELPVSVDPNTNEVTDIDGNTHSMSLVGVSWSGSFDINYNNGLPQVETTAHYRYYTLMGIEDQSGTDDVFAMRGYNAYIVVVDTALYNTWVRLNYPIPNENECENYEAGEITASASLTAGEVLHSISPATGTTYSINYIWQKCVDGDNTNLADYNWQSVANQTSEDFTIPSGWTGTNYVRRAAISGCGIIYTNISTLNNDIVTCTETITAGEISGSQTICDGEDPSIFTSITPATGNTDLAYQWQYSQDQISWLDAAGETNETWDLAAIDYGYTTQTDLYARRMATDCSGIVYSNTITMTVDVCASIDDMQETSFSIYPNPATNQLTVDNIQLVENIKILDITGKVLIEHHCEQSEAISIIDINQLQNGVYFIKVGGQVKKFVKN